MRTLLVTGFLAKDSEVETLPSGNKIFKAVMASNEYGDEKNPDGSSKTLWVNISSFKEDAIRKSQYLKKGSSIIAIGDLKVRTYQAKNGEWMSGIEVTNADIKFNNVGKKEDSQQHNKFPDESTSNVQTNVNKNNSIDNEDIPIITTPLNNEGLVSTSSDDDDLPF